MRVVGGNLRGRRLHPVGRASIRPTADRLREAVFNILSTRVREAVVLDLFAGTGALGIEALSRGAAFATFLEKQRAALAVLAKNIDACGLDPQARLIKWDILRNLNCLGLNQPQFNLVFMDPPYDQDMVNKALHNLHCSGTLIKGACIMVEHTPRETISDGLEGYELQDRRRYGKTLVSFLGYMV